MPLALAPSRGEFDLDLGAEGAGQKQAIVISSLQACDVGLFHADPPRELRLGPAFRQPGSDRRGNIFNDVELAAE